MATTEDYDALLTALALIDAYAEADGDKIDALLVGQDAAPVISNLLEVLTRMLRALGRVTGQEPHAPIELMRRRTLAQMAGQ